MCCWEGDQVPALECGSIWARMRPHFDNNGSVTSQSTPTAALRLRAALFVPAVRPDFINKLPERGADAAIIDCEDATPIGAKAEGRANARELAPQIAAAGVPVFVRVNAQATEWFNDDITHGLAPELSGVVVPMVETLDGLQQATAALGAAGLDHLGIIAGLETARGVADARELLAHSHVVGAYFGAEDYMADLGGARTESNTEVLLARQQVVQAGRLAGVATLDQVVTNFRDDDRFSREASEARAFGFSGKLCIHPNQVPLAMAAFTPSPEAVDHAQRLLAAYAEATANGLAAIDFEGQMVDEPVAQQARRLLELAG